MQYTNFEKDVITVALLGALAGIRSLLPQAVVSRALQDGQVLRLPPAFRKLASKPVAQALAGAALLELAGDKMPGMPHRISPLPLLGRTLSGGVAGFVIGSQRLRSRPLFAAIGAGTALLSALGSYGLRMAAIRKLNVSSNISGVVEDGLAMLGARALMKRLSV